MLTIRVGGVPEHFNMPWHWASNCKIFDYYGFDVQYTDFPGGTGAMKIALQNNEIDMALMLTEGAILSILEGYPYKILQWYVKSPLVWGVYVSANSDINSMDEIANKKFAISRLGSGSHLMSKVLAFQNDFKIEENQFVIVNHLPGAVQALQNEVAEVFLWEKFTTKPLVDNDTFKKIGELPTPWSSFVWVANNNFIKDNALNVSKLQSIMNEINFNFKEIPFCKEMIANKFKLKEEDVAEWLETVQWAENSCVLTDEMNAIKQMIFDFRLISNTEDSISLVHKFA
jgi:sulfonate transport system substrate-binding protein